MKHKARKTKNNTVQPRGTYVLYGFCRSDIDDVGYLAKFPSDEDDEVISDYLDKAMRFNESNVDAAVKYANDEFRDVYGPHAYAFHKVKVIS